MPLATVINTNFKMVLKQKNKGAGEKLALSYITTVADTIYTHLTILDAPTILMDTIELLFFLGYPKVFYSPTILMDTIDF